MPALDQALRAALDDRENLLSQLHSQDTYCYRLFHGTQEGAPGLTVDRYGPQLLVQSFHQPLEHDALLQLADQIQERLGQPLLLVYNDRSKSHSRINRNPELHQAEAAALEDLVGQEWGLNYRVRGRHAGQDPLLFLDLRNARGWVKANSAGKSVLNLFAYTCGVGLCAAAGGAREVVNLDFAEGNLAVGRENAALNPGLPTMQFIQSDYFPAIRQLADFSLTPSFATAVQQMNGRIGVLDNQKPQAASVDIQGKVDRYAPMSIKGKLTPFDPLNSLDIATSFKNVELTTITPYSGKFAGYRIRKGRLNLDLHYRIEKGQLNAENKVLVENLQLGERVDSPDAVDLPIRLAVALLKDTQGRIAIELPVQGDLNNPQFSVMPIVWQTLRNLVLRSAQAPFKFIAGLVGGSNVDLSTVPFVAGSAELQGDARQALDTLAKALEERPNLRLEVEGQAAQNADGPLLAEQRLQREFRETWYKVLQRRGDRVPASPDELTVAEDEQAALLEGIYRTRLKQQPPAEWAEMDKEQRQQNMRKAVLDSWAQSKLLLRQLAQQRAATIKDYLVEQGGLYDERVYLIDANLGEPEADGRVLTTLHLDSQ